MCALRPNLILIGYRGSGKTTVGRLLAQRLGWSFLDSDEWISRRAGCSIVQIFQQQGEERFRQLETEMLSAQQAAERLVFSLGGGIIESAINRTLIRELGQVIWLSAEEAELHRRLLKDTGNDEQRPPLTSLSLREEIQQVLNHRTPLYQEMADLRLDTTRFSPEQVTQRILDWFDHC
ncbi:MAG: Shikimate kinase [Phycisphaerae bacterium]|nr:Shikimate kinase [Phycisphaerae bacterium]